MIVYAGISLMYKHHDRAREGFFFALGLDNLGTYVVEPEMCLEKCAEGTGAHSHRPALLCSIVYAPHFVIVVPTP